MQPRPSAELSSELGIIPSDEVEDPYEGYDGDGDIPNDIADETVALWKTLRGHRSNRHANRPYTIDSFLSSYVQNGPRSRALANALENEDVRAALKRQGVTISFEHATVNNTEYDTKQLRSEMRALTKDRAFADFQPYGKDVDLQERTTIAACCNTDWVEDVMENAYPAIQKKAPKLLALLSQLLSAQRTTQDKIGDVLDDESKPSFVSGTICSVIFFVIVAKV